MSADVAGYRIGRALVRPQSRDLIVEEEPVKLGARAFDLLVALIERRDRIVDKSELLDLVWPGLVVEENNLQVQVLALRKVLGQQSIATIPGRGYRLVAEVSAQAFEPEGASPPDDARVERGPPSRSDVPRLPLNLIGRDADLKTLEALAAAQRLVTIVGPGGVGKTRLAQALAIRGASRCDTVAWVDLAALSSAGLVPSAVATALHAALGADDEPLGGLVQALRDRSVLIILDNAEHVVAATAHLVQRLLEMTARVAFLVTSQAPLRVAGEQVYRLGALELPPPGCGAEQALASSSVALFVERASAGARALRFDDQDLASIGTICRHLDGLPLAIELAAARTALLGLPALVRNIDQRFRLLGSGERTAPVRQQTLRAAFDWSHELLAQDARIVFRRLAVFAGSFTLEAARQVVADADLDEWSVVEQLAELIDRSLLALDDPAAARYRLLETARAFALEKLDAAGERPLLQHRHASALAQTAERCFDEFWCVSDADLLGRYVPELDNLRVALHRSEADPDLFARLAGGAILLLRRLSLTRETSALSETLALMQQAAPVSDQAVKTQAHARLCQAIAFVGYRGDLARRAAEWYRRLGDARGEYLALYPLVHDIRTAADELIAAGADCRRMRRAEWPAKLQAIGIAAEGWVKLRTGEAAQAGLLLDEAIGLCDAAGADDLGTAFRMQRWAVPIIAGDLDAAAQQMEAVLERCRTLNNPFRLTCTQAMLVNVRLAQDHTESARSLAAEFAAHDRALGWPHACEIADALSLLAAREGRFEDAAHLAGFADRVALERGSEQRDEASELARVRVARMLYERLGAERLSQLKHAGASLDCDRAVALALQAAAP